MNKAVFLDRDGVINKNRNDYVKTIDELEIYPFVGKAIQKLKEMDFIIIVVTNQSAINRNLMSLKNLELIHNEIQLFLEKFHTSIDKFYFCPHTPQENCNCRKPRTDLFLKAISEYDINPKHSWVIGDRDSDLQAGREINCSVIKVDQYYSLEDAVEKILTNNSSLKK